MGHCFIEAIRSVTHLVLAPVNQRSSSQSALVHVYIKSFWVFVFLVIDCAHPVAAGPENLQCRFAFIQFVRALVHPTPSPGAGVQPVFDSRHGRIALQNVLKQSTALAEGQCTRLQSVLKGLKATPPTG